MRKRMQPGARRAGFTLLEIMIIVGIIGMLTSIAIPSIFKFTRDQVREKACLNNLRILNDAKQRAGMESSMTTGALTWEMLKPYFQTYPLKCSAGGEYQIGDINESAICTIHGARP